MIDSKDCPEHIKESLLIYVKGRPTGDFLKAVLENDLTEAMGRADDHNLKVLPAIVAFCYNELPATCWGSKERVEKWLAGGFAESDISSGHDCRED